MTEYTPPAVAMEWAPTREGIELCFQKSGQAVQSFMLPMSGVQELWNDMEEAYWLGHSREKVECPVEDILPQDWINVLGNLYCVKNVLKQLHGREVQVVLQFEYSTHSDVPCEIILPDETLVTVFRPIE